MAPWVLFVSTMSIPIHGCHLLMMMMVVLLLVSVMMLMVLVPMVPMVMWGAQLRHELGRWSQSWR